MTELSIGCSWLLLASLAMPNRTGLCPVQAIGRDLLRVGVHDDGSKETRWVAAGDVDGPPHESLVSFSGAKAHQHSTSANSPSAKEAPLRKAPSTRGPEHQSLQAPMVKSPSNTGLRQDGSTFAIESSSALIRNTAGTPVAMMAVYRDITERMRTEKNLTIFRRFVEAVTQGFGMANLDGYIVHVNPFLARLDGAQSPEEVIGNYVSTYYPPDYMLRREREIIPALRRGPYWQGELMMAFSDGQMHPTIHSIFPVCDDRGELLRTAAIITDITDLKQSEAKLKCEQRALRRMLLASDHERRLVTYDLHDGVAQQQN